MTEEDIARALREAHIGNWLSQPMIDRLATALEQVLSEQDQAVTASKEFLDSVVVAAGLGHVSNTGTIPRKIAELRARTARLEAALNVIAAWDEGPVVTGSFDCPGNAQFARAALAEEAKP